MLMLKTSSIRSSTFDLNCELNWLSQKMQWSPYPAICDLDFTGNETLKRQLHDIILSYGRHLPNKSSPGSHYGS